MTNLQDLQQELWKDIPGYEGRYQASTFGRIKSLGRLVRCVHNSGKEFFKWHAEKIMKPALGTKNEYMEPYLYVIFYNNSLPDRRSVHSLVMLAFIGKPTDGKPVVMHLDDNPQNNFLSNLRYGSASENNMQSVLKGRRTYDIEQLRKLALKNAMKTAKPVVAISVADKSEKEFPSAREAARQTGVFSAAIHGVCKGKYGCKTAGGYIWKFKEAG